MGKIEDVTNKGITIRVEIKSMDCKHEYSSGSKNYLLCAYIDIMYEHHESVYLLIGKKLYGAAFALERSLFETLFRALWVNACASEEQIKQICTDDGFEFPRTMMNEIDKKYTTDGFFWQVKKGSWKAMCSYTHSGLLQISRRFKGDDVDPYYCEGEIVEVLNASNIAILLMARLFFVSMNKTAEAQRVENMMLQYES